MIWRVAHVLRGKKYCIDGSDPNIHDSSEGKKKSISEKDGGSALAHKFTKFAILLLF